MEPSSSIDQNIMDMSTTKSNMKLIMLSKEKLISIHSLKNIMYLLKNQFVKAKELIQIENNLLLLDEKN